MPKNKGNSSGKTTSITSLISYGVNKGTLALLFSIVLLGGGVALAASLEGRTQDVVLTPRTETISVSIEVEGVEYQVSLAPGSSAYDAMVQAKEASGLEFEGKEFSGLGFFMEEINGLRQNPRAGKYWIYYLNGRKAEVGISAYIVKEHDVISWRYEDKE